MEGFCRNAVCPECGVAFKATHHLRVFCCSRHQIAYHVRSAQRGKVLLPLAQVWRTGKRGKTEARAYAFGEVCALLDQWAAEDKAAGRRPDVLVDIKHRTGWRAVDLVS